MCLNLYDPMDCTLPGSSVSGSLQARILKWVAVPSLTQGSVLGLLHCGQIYCLSPQGSCMGPSVLDIVQNGKLRESNYWWIRLPLCLLSSLLSFFFCEWPVSIFCTFFYLVLIFLLLIFQDLKKKWFLIKKSYKITYYKDFL